MFNHTIIMAAGREMRPMPLPLTQFNPKPMAKFKGTTLIGDLIRRINDIIPNIHITVGYKGADLARHVIEKDVTSIFNTEGKGNAWWLFNSLLKYIDEPILVLTCDNVVDLDLEKIYEDYKSLKMPACMVVPVIPVPGLDGDYIFQKANQVNEINRRKVSEIYCSGIQVLNPELINRLCRPTEVFYDVWVQLIKLKQLYCSNVYPKKWLVIDTIGQRDE